MNHKRSITTDAPFSLEWAVTPTRRCSGKSADPFIPLTNCISVTYKHNRLIYRH